MHILKDIGIISDISVYFKEYFLIGGGYMTKKRWFQWGVGILLTLFIIKYFVEVNWIFSPLAIIGKAIFIPLLIAGILFYISVPFQTFLERKRIPRWGSISIIFMTLIIGIWFIISIIGPLVTKQINHLVESTPQIVTEISNLTDDLLERRGELPEGIQEEIDDKINSLHVFAFDFGKWILQFFQSLIQATFILILVPFFLIYMLKDHEKFKPFILQFFSGHTKKWLKDTMHDIDTVLKSYIQGQILISSILSLLLFLGYTVIGLNYALLLAIFAFFMNVIPFIGPWIAFIPALLIAFFQDPTLVIWVSLITLAAQQIDANLITPNIMGKSLDIHPLTVIALLLAAGNMAGFLGILLAIPTYAVIKAIVKNIYKRRQTIKKAASREI